MDSRASHPPVAPSGVSQHPVGQDVDFTIAARRLVWLVFLVCVAIEIILVLLDYHLNYGRGTEIGALRRLFNNTREDGLGSWFAVTQTTLVALTLWLVVAVARRMHSRGVALGWVILALFFSYMALDDGAMVHERVGTAFKELHRQEGAASWRGRVLAAFPTYAWQLVFVPVFGALGIFMLAFLWRQLVEPWARLSVVAALGCFALAVGLDFVEGLEPDHPWNLHAWLARGLDLEAFSRARFRRGAFHAVGHFSRSLEETLEMFANTLLWCVFLQYLTGSVRELRIRFVHGAGTAPTAA